VEGDHSLLRQLLAVVVGAVVQVQSVGPACNHQAYAWTAEKLLASACDQIQPA